MKVRVKKLTLDEFKANLKKYSKDIDVQVVKDLKTVLKLKVIVNFSATGNYVNITDKIKELKLYIKSLGLYIKNFESDRLQVKFDIDLPK